MIFTNINTYYKYVSTSDNDIKLSFMYVSKCNEREYYLWILNAFSFINSKLSHIKYSNLFLYKNKLIIGLFF